MPVILGSIDTGILGTVTLGEVKAIVQAEGYGNDTSSQQTLMARSVLRRLVGMRRWPFLESVTTTFQATLANTGNIDISALGRGIQLDSVRIEQGTDYRGDADMEWLSDVDIRNLRHVDRTTGYPTKWGRSADSLLVWPLPDGTYPLTIAWYGLTTLPAADGDIVQWPETHIDVLVYGIIMRLCRRQRDWNGLAAARQDFTEALGEMMREEGMTQRQTDLNIARWSGWDKLI